MFGLRRYATALAVPLAAVLAACGGGGGSPAAPSGFSGVTLTGTVVGGGATSSALRSTSSVTAGTLTVTVQENTAITATVGPSGTFTLRGLPEGTFTLVFTLDGAVIASVPFSEVKPNQQITITVALEGQTLVVVEQKRNGIGHGDVEIEGRVEQVLVVDPQGESRFVIDGRTVIARPGDTAVREGGRARSVDDVTVGRHVHVKGVWLAMDAQGQPVLAWEIKLQGPSSGPAPSPTAPPTSACPTGANTQVEGIIQSKGGSSIVVHQQGKGDFECLVSSATRIRKGNTDYTFAQLQPGWRVHVSGAGLGASGNLCQVRADEIKVQQQ